MFYYFVYNDRRKKALFSYTSDTILWSVLVCAAFLKALVLKNPFPKSLFYQVKIGSEFIICVKRVGCILRKFLPCYQHLSFSCFYQDSHRVSCASNMELFLSSLNSTHKRAISAQHKYPQILKCGTFY